MPRIASVYYWIAYQRGSGTGRLCSATAVGSRGGCLPLIPFTEYHVGTPSVPLGITDGAPAQAPDGGCERVTPFTEYHKGTPSVPLGLTDGGSVEPVSGRTFCGPPVPFPPTPLWPPDAWAWPATARAAARKATLFQ